jgi:hypothetical protein
MRPESVNNADTLKADARWKMRFHARIVSPHIQQVRRVDRACQDTNPRFPLPRFRERQLLNRKNFCGLTVLIE